MDIAQRDKVTAGPGANAGSPQRPRHPNVTLFTTCLALLLGQVDTQAVNLALPAIHRQLAGDFSGLQWVVDGYNVAFTALLLTGGTLGDRYGRRLLFRMGVAVFVLGSAGCALAPTIAVLLVGRVVQGAGAALMLPQSLAILATAFPGRRERNRAMAAWSVVAGAGLAIGPTLGGFAVQEYGWHSIFWINLPLGALALLLSDGHVPESRNPAARGLDPLGQSLAILALGLLTFVAVDGRGLGWASPVTLGCAAGCVAALAGFVAVERRHKEPMVPLNLLRRGQLPVAAIAAACMTFGMYGFVLLLSLGFQQGRGMSALGAGLAMLPLPVVFTACSPLVAPLVTRRGARPAMTCGLGLMGAGLLLYALVGPSSDLVLVSGVLAVTGLGLALNTGPVVGVAVSAVAPELAGLASGVANLARMFGATLGVAVMGSVLAAVSGGGTHGAALDSGLRAAAIVGCAVEWIGALVAAWKVRGDRARG
jgi:EmrB/QacA subfamily drug resistance transporter